MPKPSSVLPKQSLIWPGAILGSIAHAVYVCRCPDFSHEQSWDGSNYNVQDSAGSRGTIAFAENKFVAAFFYEPSNRNPFQSDLPYRLDRFFANMPADLDALAHNETLQYLLQERNTAKTPIVTSAFWGDGSSEWVGCAEHWTQVVKHGAILVQNQLLDAERALSKWAEDYALDPLEIEFVKALFHRKLKAPADSIELNQSEKHLWRTIAAGKEGLDASRESFAEINIIIK